MKIAVDISQVVFEGTGVATYTKNLVHKLLRLNRSEKHEYLLYGASLRKMSVLSEFSMKLASEGLKFKSKIFPFPPTLSNIFWNELHSVNIENLIGRVDLFHSSDWVEPPSSAKKITTIHDLVVYTHPNSTDSTIISVQKKKLSWVKTESDAVIVDSFATKKDCEEILKIASEKLHVVPLAASDGALRFASQSISVKNEEIKRIRSKYHLKKPYFLAVGTRQPRKNLNILVDAIKENKSVELIIVGKYGWGDEKFTNDSNIRILGFVDDEDLQPLFAGSIAHVQPSLYEGFGLTVLEAMMLETPVLSSNVSSLPEVGGDAALYFNPNNKSELIEKLSSLLGLSMEARSELIQKGRNQAKMFTWEKTALETLKIYEQVLG